MTKFREFLALNPALEKQDEPRTVNRLIDSEWTFVDTKSSKTRLVNFKDTFGLLTPSMEVFVKQVLGGESDILYGATIIRSLDGTLNTSLFSQRKIIRILKVIIECWQAAMLDGVHTLAEWDSARMRELYSKALDGSTFTSQRRVFSGVSAATSFKYFVNSIEQIHRAFKHNELLDGFNQVLPIDYLMSDFAMKEALKLNPTFELAPWRKGGKLDGLAVTHSIALLMATLKFLRCDKVRLVIAGLTAVHKKVVTRDYVAKGLKAGTFTTLLSGKTSSKAKRAQFEKILCDAFEVDTFDDLPESAHRPLERELDGAMGDEASEIAVAIVPMAMLVIAVVTGIRRNELESIEWGEIYPEEIDTGRVWQFVDQRESWKFKSNINKTNQGLKTVRYLGGIAGEMVDLLATVNKAIGEPLEGALFKKAAFLFDSGRTNVASGDWCRKAMPDRIKWFINPQLADDLKINNFSIHSVRHAWAEFALRRFDGDMVPELVRQHFRHHWDSYMTQHYLHGKVMEEDNRDFEREYIAELIGRAVKGDLRLYGDVGKFIHAQIDQYEYIGEDELELIVERFDGHIDVHEYGFCMVRRETQSVAKCFDKKAGLPQTKEGCWEKCGGCANRLTLPEHRDDIQRLLLSYEGSIRSFKQLNLIPLADAYEEGRKRAEAALAELDQREETSYV